MGCYSRRAPVLANRILTGLGKLVEAQRGAGLVAINT